MSEEVKDATEGVGKSVVYMQLSESDKHSLRKIAKSKGLQLVPFCRMVLLEYLKNNKE